MRRTRTATAAIAAFVAAAILASMACEPLPPEHASWSTRSFYMGSGDGGAASNLGCRQGDKQGRMTLFFGSPVAVDGTYGATLWSAPNRTTAQVAQTVEAFVEGYAWCRADPSFQLLVGVGTSNSAIDTKTTPWIQSHGRAWAQMVASVSTWAEANYPSQVRVFGAWDAEPAWSTFQRAEAWMHGYDDFADARPLHANYSADGCPQADATNGGCNNGWNQNQVWHLAWQHDPALPMPQIYATSGANARQWAMIDAYGASRGDGMFFYGAMAQRAACDSTGSACPGTNNTAGAARDQLLWALNSRESTRQPVIQSTTDIDWYP